MRVLYADGDAAGDFFLRSTEQLPQRNVARLGFRIPHGIFYCAFGHAMSTDLTEQSHGVSSAFHLLSQQRGS
jgi:hypothetical protein